MGGASSGAAGGAVGSSDLRTGAGAQAADAGRVGTTSGCAWCGEVRGQMLMCTGCGVVMYCTRKHQKRHWKASHRGECATPKAAAAPAVQAAPRSPHASLEAGDGVSHGGGASSVGDAAGSGGSGPGSEVSGGVGASVDGAPRRSGSSGDGAAAGAAEPRSLGSHATEWRITRSSVTELLACMCKHGYCVVDGFATGPALASTIRQVRGLLRGGKLTHTASKIGVSVT